MDIIHVLTLFPTILARVSRGLDHVCDLVPDITHTVIPGLT